MPVIWMFQMSLLLTFAFQACVIRLEGMPAEERGSQGTVALVQLVPTMSLCDCVAPYMVIPLDGAAGCGVSGWMYPLLSMRLQKNKHRKERLRKSATMMTTLFKCLSLGSLYNG